MYQLHVIGLFIDMRPMVVVYVVVPRDITAVCLHEMNQRAEVRCALICSSSICIVSSDTWALYRSTSGSYSYA
jgi:hypothetical protein